MVIITGASGGLGQALVRELVHDDLVVGTYWQHKPDFGALNVRLHRVDVSDTDSVNAFAQDIRSEAKHVVLVNLAGVAIDRVAVSLSPEDWDTVLGVNLTGAFLMSQAVVRLMMRQRWGRIINIGSVVTHLGATGTAAYAAAKGALLPMTRVLAHEYGRYNVTANCIELGYFEAGLIEQVSDERKSALLARTPVRRFGRPSELAHTIRYLIASEFTTGASIPLTGGIV